MKHLFLLERAYWYLCSMLIWEDLVKTWEGEFVPFGLNERELDLCYWARLFSCVTNSQHRAENTWVQLLFKSSYLTLWTEILQPTINNSEQELWLQKVVETCFLAVLQDRRQRGGHPIERGGCTHGDPQILPVCLLQPLADDQDLSGPRRLLHHLCCLLCLMEKRSCQTAVKSTEEK